MGRSPAPDDPPGVVTYRRAVADDAGFVASLAGPGSAGWQGASVSADVVRRRLTALIDDEDALVLVAEAGDRPVAVAKAHRMRPAATDPAPPGVYLAGVHVVDGWRRRGIGRELTVRRLTWIWGRADEAWCFTNAANTASIALHTGVGFVEVGRAPAYAGVDFGGGTGVLLRAVRPAPPD